MLSIGTHEGDSWEAALLVMNRGNRSGNAFLTVELDNMTHGSVDRDTTRRCW